MNGALRKKTNGLNKKKTNGLKKVGTNGQTTMREQMSNINRYLRVIVNKLK